jgi:hypothetical protein
VVLDDIAKEWTQRVTCKISYSWAHECVNSSHPPFKPSVHFHIEQLIHIVRTNLQKIAIVFDHDIRKHSSWEYHHQLGVSSSDKCPHALSVGEGHRDAALNSMRAELEFSV